MKQRCIVLGELANKEAGGTKGKEGWVTMALSYFHIKVMFKSSHLASSYLPMHSTDHTAAVISCLLLL